jgi:hypothetical protein
MRNANQLTDSEGRGRLLPTLIGWWSQKHHSNACIPAKLLMKERESAMGMFFSLRATLLCFAPASISNFHLFSHACRVYRYAVPWHCNKTELIINKG